MKKQVNPKELNKKKKNLKGGDQRIVATSGQTSNMSGCSRQVTDSNL